MARLYAVVISTTALIWADDKDEAAQMALDDHVNIMNDLEQEVTVVEANVQLRGVLAYGWSPNDVPYGDAEGRTIKELLNIEADIPERDDKTLPLFGQLDDEVTYVCPGCGSNDVSEEPREEVIENAKKDVVLVSVPMLVCASCRMEYTDYRAEEIRKKARQ